MFIKYIAKGLGLGCMCMYMYLNSTLERITLDNLSPVG